MTTKQNINVCPHNEGVGCITPDCERCGWYPPVAAKIAEEVGNLKKYKIPFTGYCEVWAMSPEEALEKADHDEMFFAHYDFGEVECLTRGDENELD